LLNSPGSQPCLASHSANRNRGQRSTAGLAKLELAALATLGAVASDSSHPQLRRAKHMHLLMLLLSAEDAADSCKLPLRLAARQALQQAAGRQEILLQCWLLQRGCL
jgi:hypothetical protein